MWCPIRVNAVLEGLPGFIGSTVDMTTARVTVRYDAAILDASEIVRVINESPDYSSSQPRVLRAVSHLDGMRWTASVDARDLAESGSASVIIRGKGRGRVKIEPAELRGISFEGDRTEWDLDPASALEIPFRLYDADAPTSIRISLERDGRSDTVLLPVSAPSA